MIEWHNAPFKTQWGDCMRHATIELDKNSVLDLYCDQDDLHKVEEALRKIVDGTKPKK